MPRLSLMLTVLLLSLLAASAAPALGQTPAPATPPASPTASLSGVSPLSLTGEQLAEFEAYITEMLAETGVPGAAVAVVQKGTVV